MPIDCLTPRDLTAPARQASTYTGIVMIRAMTENVARHEAIVWLHDQRGGMP
jgi:hypothetical protein